MQSILLLLLLVDFVSQGYGEDLSSCPAGVKNYGNYLHGFQGRCYLFVTFQQRTWDEARAECHHWGGRLATVPDSDTQNFLANMTSQPATHFTHAQMWIGLTDAASEGTWVWDTGDKAGFTSWTAGQPGTFISFIEDCVVMIKSHGYNWDDISCNHNNNYICEFGTPPVIGTNPATSTKAADGTSSKTLVTSSVSTPPPAITPASTPPGAVMTSKAPISTGSAGKPGVTYPSFCGAFSCVLNCGDKGFKTDIDGCPTCSCQGE